MGGVLGMVMVVAILGGGFIFVTKYLPGILQKVQAAPGGTAATVAACSGTCTCVPSTTGTCVCQENTSCACSSCSAATNTLHCPDSCQCITDDKTGNCVCKGNSNCPCHGCQKPVSGASTGTSKRINTINKLVGYTGPVYPSGQPKCLIGDTACYKAGLAHVFTAHSLNRISNRSHG